jgi:hypothetical protein
MQKPPKSSPLQLTPDNAKKFLHQFHNQTSTTVEQVEQNAVKIISIKGIIFIAIFSTCQGAFLKNMFKMVSTLAYRC